MVGSLATKAEVHGVLNILWVRLGASGGVEGFLGLLTYTGTCNRGLEAGQYSEEVPLLRLVADAASLSAAGWLLVASPV